MTVNLYLFLSQGEVYRATGVKADAIACPSVGGRHEPTSPCLLFIMLTVMISELEAALCPPSASLSSTYGSNRCGIVQDGGLGSRVSIDAWGVSRYGTG